MGEVGFVVADVVGVLMLGGVVGVGVGRGGHGLGGIVGVSVIL